MATIRRWKTVSGGCAVVLFLAPLWAMTSDPDGDALDDAAGIVLASLDSPPEATLRNLHVGAQGTARVCGEVRDPSGPLRSSRYQRFVADLGTREVVVDPGGRELQPSEQRIFGRSAATDGRSFAEYFAASCSSA
jgi:hypothetical protein